MKKIFILDAVNFLFRSYYGIKPMTNAKGASTHALFGFIRSVYKIIEDFSPDYLVAVFDGPDNKKSRTEIYKEYKSHRKSMPEDLFPQLEEAFRFCKLAGIHTLVIPGVEADDTIGSLVKWTKEHHLHTYICTSDKDLCQLVSDSVFLVHAHKNNQIADKNTVMELFGVRPDQIVDYLSLIGDASDNIPGISGIGPKTASDLLSQYGTLEAILEKAHTLGGKKGILIHEGKENALLSKQLASLDSSIPIPQEIELYKTFCPNQKALKQFYQEHNLLSLVKKQDSEEEEPLPLQQDYKTITSLEELQELLSLLQKKSSICFDTETTTLRPMESSLVGIGLGCLPRKAYYIPLNGKLARQDVLHFLTVLFSTKHLSFYGHNIKYDLHILTNEGIPLPKIDFDTTLASYLLTPHNPKHGLDDLCMAYFSHAKIPLEDLVGKGKSQISIEQVAIDRLSRYCCESIDYIMRLKELLTKKLDEKNLLSVLQTIELPLLPVLLSMERKGLFLDLPFIRKLSYDFSQKIASLETTIHEMAGETFNVNSPKQLSTILFTKLGLHPPKKTQTGFSTSAEVLEGLAAKSPIIAPILEYRQMEKLRSTYTDALQEEVNPFTHRIHCNFNQSMTATGRLSCQNPNLQNIPVRTEDGKKIRMAFRPEKEDWNYLSADYSQIELRLLAHLSEDPILLQAFTSGEDVHAHTASVIFNIPLADVTSEMRHRAKAVNFGVIYGQQAFGLSQGLKMTYHEASRFIDTYFDRYKKVKDYIEHCKEFARKNEFVLTMTGRQRPIPDIHSKNPMLKALAERLAVNSPLQGTAADLIKLAMIHIQEHWKFKESFMILQIHDELLFEASKEELHPLSLFVKEHMEHVFSLKVPLVVDISIGKNWGAC
ncbi:MAG: DNA polymerase I [Chlamydiota bacterium]